MMPPTTARPVRPIAALVLLGLLLCSCKGDGTGQPPGTARIRPDDPEETGRRTTLLFTDSSAVKARLIVGRARKYSKRLETLLDSGLYVEFYNSNAELDAVLLADSARIDDRTKDMVAYGRVHVRSDKNRTVVDTDKLHYSNQTRRLSSDAPVTIIDSLKGRYIQGVGFDTDESLTDYRIYNASGRTLGPGGK